MADTMQGLRRTCLCGEVTLEMGEVVVGGFTQRVRDKGSLIFIDLRDKSGIVQLVFDETTEKSVFEKAESVRSEYVLLAKGTVRARESVNTEIKTGGIEIVVTELRILSKAQTPPFEIVSNTKTNEELRLKYRYLDLRREPLQKNLMMRHEIAKAAREYFYANGFTEIETPMMIKSTPEGELETILRALGCEKGDVALIVADKDKVTLPVLGALRLKIAKQLDIIPEGWNFLWIVEFPFFEYDEESGEWLAMHHPFTMPLDECIPYLDTDKARVRAKCYDLVLNGIELSSGSIRITDPELQQHMFEMLGMTDEEINAKFGFLVDAYKYGAPPHGGAGIGLDRLAMLMCGCDSLRDVTAFPKVQNASELMSEAPSTVSEEQLKELGIAITNSEE